MAGRGGEDHFRGWFYGASQENTNQRDVTSLTHLSYQDCITPQNHYPWGWEFQPSQDHLDLNPNFYTNTPQPQNHLIPPPNHLLQNPTLQNPMTQNNLVDMRYNHVNSPRGSSCGSTQYGLRLSTIPSFDNGFDEQSLETGLSRLNLSTPSRLSNQFLGTSSDSGVSYPPYGFNNYFFNNDFQPTPYSIENQVDHDWQGGFERSRMDYPVSRRSGVHARNRVAPFLANEGSEDLRFRRSVENNNQYRNSQIGSRRNSYPELNRPAGSCLCCLDNSNSFSSPRRNQFSGDDLNRGYRSRSRLELGSQGLVGRSVNDSRFNFDSSLSPYYGNHVPAKPRSQQTYSLEELQGRVCSVARDPQARGFLEEKVGERDQAYIELIFSEVQNELFDLIVDYSANHLMQKFVGVLNEDQLNKFILIITTSERRLLGICDDSYGTYVMQRLLEVSLTRVQKSLLVSVLKHIAAVLSKTQHGHHVIMHCLKKFPNEITVDLVEEIILNCVDLATNKSGCCVLQHCLQHVDDGEQKGRLVTEIVANALILSGDAFGNYVVQNLLDNVPEATNNVVAQLAGNYFVLSMSRFGSNVVEKCLKIANGKQSIGIMVEIINHPDILELVKDNYGNFVIQSIWKAAQGHQAIRQTLFSLIQMNSHFLRSHIYAKKVVDAIMGNRR